MDLNNVTKKAAIGIAAVSGSLYYMLQDPVVVALLPEPFGMLVSKFIGGLAVGGVAYNMIPKQDAPKDEGIRG